ncbi:hypothetical protein P7C70_g5500, partial [Phenoliferia sp. Uapishka_3]
MLPVPDPPEGIRPPHLMTGVTADSSSSSSAGRAQAKGAPYASVHGVEASTGAYSPNSWSGSWSDQTPASHDYEGLAPSYPSSASDVHTSYPPQPTRPLSHSSSAASYSHQHHPIPSSALSYPLSYQDPAAIGSNPVPVVGAFAGFSPRAQWSNKRQYIHPEVPAAFDSPRYPHFHEASPTYYTGVPGSAGFSGSEPRARGHQPSASSSSLRDWDAENNFQGSEMSPWHDPNDTLGPSASITSSAAPFSPSKAHLPHPHPAFSPDPSSSYSASYYPTRSHPSWDGSILPPHIPSPFHASPAFASLPNPSYAGSSVASSSRPSTAYSDRPTSAYSDTALSSYPAPGVADVPTPARFALLDVSSPLRTVPLVLPEGSSVSPLVVAASRNRQSKSTLQPGPSVATPKQSRRRIPNVDDLDGRRAGKPRPDRDCLCVRCGVEIAKLLFRGNSAVPYRVTYFCMACVPLPKDVVDARPVTHSGYADSLSAYVDLYEGCALVPTDDRPPPKRERPTSQRKLRAEVQGVFCDVCVRAVGSGGVVSEVTNESVSFGVEVVCVQCNARYRRCTDCGGGGGPRIGVGKWRCAELFPEGRRTCQLSHLRLPNLAEMSYDIWPVEYLPPSELDEFIQQAFQAYCLHLYATLATPGASLSLGEGWRQITGRWLTFPLLLADILESEIAMARTFEELKKLAMDGWSLVEPMLRPPLSAPSLSDSPVKRYLALRWATPTHRKNKAAEVDSKYHDHETGRIPATLIRPEKNLAGFVIAELDLETGTLLLALTTPWATGQS